MVTLECQCGAELSSVYSSRNVELRREGETWIEKTVFFSGCQCPNCHEELDDHTLETLGVPVEYR